MKCQFKAKSLLLRKKASQVLNSRKLVFIILCTEDPKTLIHTALFLPLMFIPLPKYKTNTSTACNIASYISQITKHIYVAT